VVDLKKSFLLKVAQAGCGANPFFYFRVFSHHCTAAKAAPQKQDNLNLFNLIF
jgi:hypothetical protein